MSREEEILNKMNDLCIGVPEDQKPQLIINLLVMSLAIAQEKYEIMIKNHEAING